MPVQTLGVSISIFRYGCGGQRVKQRLEAIKPVRVQDALEKHARF